MKEMLYFYCPKCDDFYPDKAICFDSIKTYLTSTIENCLSDCPGGHVRSIVKTESVFYKDKPMKNISSTVICFDVVSFSKKKESEQYNIISLIQSIAREVILKQSCKVVFKGTGDGYIIALLNESVENALKLIEDMVLNYYSHMKYMKYRIGIDYGTMFSYPALNTEIDIFGKTVIDACRISDFGDDCHILISKNAKENISVNTDWTIRYLSNIKDKHDISHIVYNCFKEKVGCKNNPKRYKDRSQI